MNPDVSGQDRLCKALRLAGINDLESANRFLAEAFLPQLDRRFARAAASPLDMPRSGAAKPGRSVELGAGAGGVPTSRQTVACDGKWYQLNRQHEALSLVRRKVIVRTLRDGRVQSVSRGRKLKWRQRPGRPTRVRAEPVKTRRVVVPPAAGHPWRRFGMGVGREYWREVQARGRAARPGEQDNRQ